MGSFEEILVKKHLKRTKARVMILKVLEKSRSWKGHASVPVHRVQKL